MTVNTDKLVRMAEQVTANMNYTDDKKVVAAKVADHLNKFWDQRMKTAIMACAHEHNRELSPPLRAAISQLE